MSKSKSQRQSQRQSWQTETETLICLTFRITQPQLRWYLRLYLVLVPQKLYLSDQDIQATILKLHLLNIIVDSIVDSSHFVSLPFIAHVSICIVGNIAPVPNVTISIYLHVKPHE